ncbi:hypothetical protein [Clostridium perfringens]|uniref:hypothetical protein n=1 Tax=Clostridium perfringens TaxID=1502 RepID=UPI0024BCC86C|nr:hypothetical protein [Clostridium perfringens]MDU7548340.1 hypothetical protein [Clostridium perfringens]
MMKLNSKENDAKRLVEEMVDIKEELNNEYTYEVLTKDEYIKRALIGLSFTKEELNEHWNKISNGFNFIIKCGKNEYCSVGRFNKMLEV